MLALRPEPDDALPGELEYTGEFGQELILFLPWITWLSRCGLLRDRRVVTYKGMSCFYEGLDYKEYREKDGARTAIPSQTRPDWFPVATEHRYAGHEASPFHLFQDMRRRFAAKPLLSLPELGRKPLVVVHNKHNDEWTRGPINHMPVEQLDQLLGRLTAAFDVIYIRHGLRPLDQSYVHDANDMLPFDDASVLRRHPQVMEFHDLFDRERAAGGTVDINMFKNLLYARCWRFVSSQGGGAHHIACFSGSILVVLHRGGREVELSYGDGFYNLLARPAPIRLICDGADQLARAVDVFFDSAVVDGVALVSASKADLLRRFSPFRFQRAPV